MEQLDCRGLACPQPVMRSRDAVAGGAQALEVLVDNEPARENLRRFFEGRGFSVAANQEGPDCWRISATAGDAAPAWAQSMRRQQDSRHRRQMAMHSLQQGDRGGGSAAPDIKERND